MRKFSLLALFVLVLFLTTTGGMCKRGSARPYTENLAKWDKTEFSVYIPTDPEAGENEVDAVWEGIKDIERATRGHLRFTRSGHLGADLIADWRWSRETHDSRIAGWANENFSVVNGIMQGPRFLYFVRGQGPFKLRRTATHEALHAVGIIGHSDNPKDLMYKESGRNGKITGNDLATLAKAYGIKL